MSSRVPAPKRQSLRAAPKCMASLLRRKFDRGSAVKTARQSRLAHRDLDTSMTEPRVSLLPGRPDPSFSGKARRAPDRAGGLLPIRLFGTITLWRSRAVASRHFYATALSPTWVSNPKRFRPIRSSTRNASCLHGGLIFGTAPASLSSDTYPLISGTGDISRLT